MIMPNDMSIDRDDKIEPIYYRNYTYLRITEPTGRTFLIYLDRKCITDMERACATLDQMVRESDAATDTPVASQTGG